jgi:hypothetical protein
MLGELFPGHHFDRRLIARLRPRKKSIVHQYPRLARSLPRLVHIELCFDNTVRICREHDPSRSVADWAQAVGRWFAGCLHLELERRARSAAAMGDQHRHAAVRRDGARDAADEDAG